MPLIVFLLFLWGGGFFVFTGCTELPDDYSPNRWVRAPKANLRTDPLLLTSVIDILEQNTPLQILTKTKEKVRIARQLDYWYYVRLGNGIEGWIYGTTLTDRPVKAAENIYPKGRKYPEEKNVNAKPEERAGKPNTVDLKSRLRKEEVKTPNIESEEETTDAKPKEKVKK